MGRIRLNSSPDTLVWDHNKNNGSATSKLVYDYIVQSSHPLVGSNLQALIWSGILPTKISCFIWLVLENKILTWDNLQRKGWIGPGIYALCNAEEDCVQHIFSLCSVWNEVISHLSGKYHFIPPHQCDNLYNYMRNWTYRFSKYSVCCYLLFFAMWTIWKVRNSYIF